MKEGKGKEGTNESRKEDRNEGTKVKMKKKKEKEREDKGGREEMNEGRKKGM
jgi:hypothetical protein